MEHLNRFPPGKRVIAWQVSTGRNALPWRACPASAVVRGFFRGTRTPVSLVFENLQDMSIDELVEEFGATREQVQTVLQFAAHSAAVVQM